MAWQRWMRWLLGLCLFGLTLYSGVLSRMERALIWTVQTAVYPCISLASSLGHGLQKAATHTRTLQELEQAYQTLTVQYEQMREQVLQLQAQASYFQDAQDLIAFKQRYQLDDKLLAKILVMHLGPDQHYAIINQGSAQGVTKDMIALYKFQIIGRVVEVGPQTSRLLLVTDKRCKIAAYAASTQAPGIVVGTNEANRCTFEFVNHLCKLCDDDMVISSGQGLVVPEGFALGTIQEHYLAGKALHHTIVIKPLVDLTALRFCILVDHSQIPLC